MKMSLKRLASLRLGNIIHGYKVLKITPVPDLKLTSVELIHEKTKAKHIHLDRDDPNKTFSVQFRTTPRDDTGVAHILEHTVLCGSHTYPVRDPFFKMLTRSLSTFMNAFTASDWTMYPFSTLNEKDFDNLLSVYMDSVLRPRLTEYDFMQEGWHLEHSNIDDPSSPLLIKGVVYNEMKGVFSSSENHLAQCIENKLLPNTYGYVSGGHPDHITELTWKQLRDFHATYYHPSNSKFYTYGNLNLEKYLEILNEDYLKRYDYKPVNSAVDLEPTWNHPKDIIINCSPDPMNANLDRQNTVAVCFRLGDITNSYSKFVESLVSHLLLDGDNAPLYRGLVESGLGTGWSGSGHGYDPSSRTASFSVKLQGVKEEDVGMVKVKVQEILSKVSEDGFPQDRIDSALHQIELSIRHDNASFGLHLILSLCYSLNHDADPSELLQISHHIEQLKTDLRNNPNFLKDIVKEKFLINPHRLTVGMIPKEGYDVLQQEAESKRLQYLTSQLKDDDNLTLQRKARELQNLQNVTEDLSCLPTLQMSDISEKVPDLQPFSIRQVSDCNIQINEAPTNGLVYLNMYSDLSHLSQDLMPFVPLFTSVLTKLGADGVNYGDMYQLIERYTSGLSAGPHISSLPNSNIDHNQGVGFSSYCLASNITQMMDLWRRIFIQPDWTDVERLATLIKIEATEEWSAHSVSSVGHSFAMKRAGSSLSPSGRINELWSGMEQATYIKCLVKEIEDGNLSSIQSIFTRLGDHVLNKKSLRLSINAESELIDDSVRIVEGFLNSIKNEGYPAQRSSSSFISGVSTNSHFVMPFSVNYAGRAYATVPYTDPNYGSFRVLAKLMTTKFLHREIREKGGAYGGGAAAKPGSFLFYSYRDPHSKETFEAFSRGIDWVLNTEISDQDLTEAKLSVFQEIDRPTAAGRRGQNYFYNKISDEMRQEHRKSLLSLTQADVLLAAQTLSNGKPSSALIGPKENTPDKDCWDIITI